MSAALWHDLECGAYAADLPLWRELATDAAGPILDVGAGTGRVALDLARRGHEVVALDREAALLDALRARAGALAVHTVRADARAFELEAQFALILVPMQTVQLLGGPAGRAAFLDCARRHMAAGARLAAALAIELEPVEEEPDALPLPDLREVEGVVYSSQPVAVRALDGQWAIERVREVVAADGRREVSRDEVRLDRLFPAQLEAEGRAAGLRPEARRSVGATHEHVGSEVVVMRHG